MDEARKLTKYLVKARFPSVGVMLLLDLTIPLAFAAVIALVLHDNLVDMLAMYFILFSLPSILATFIPIVRRDYSTAINLISLIIEVIVFTGGMLIAEEFWVSALLIGYALSFTLRYAVFMGLGVSSKRAFTASALRLLLSFCIFYIWDIFIADIQMTIKDIARRLVAITALLAAIALLFIYLISLPVRRVTGVNPFDLFASFMTDWFQGTATIEKYLKSTEISEKTKVFLDIIIFKNFKESFIKNKEKKRLNAVFIISYIHPGPFGSVGSSNMPHLLSERVGKEFNAACFVFHGSCSHDLNLVSRDDLNLVIDEVVGSVDEFAKNPTFCNISRVIEDGDVKAQRVGNKDIVFVSGFEGDIDLGVGLASSDIFVDCHSSGETVMKSIAASSEEGMKIIEICRDAREKLEDARERLEWCELTGDISLGIANSKIENEAVGQGGIMAGVLDIKGQRIAHILIDSNNMEPGLREKIIDAVKNETEADVAEVMTTDTHYVNTISGGLNLLKDDPEIIELCVKLAKKASLGMRRVRVGTERVYIDGIRVMGNASEFATSLNFSAALFKILVPVVVVLIIIAIFGALLVWG
ncbi:MAG: hypothetical protein A7316_08310 [Candidatus Altiarchaeales archaeon WOR_SM1_86-2]|nr:MAG: hypothetical protein A7316_08310 [Candidatus Altiarchaeales archaeon WOR_SM1_86-2]